MTLQIRGAAKRLILSLLLAGGLAGCAVYGPPYAYDAGYTYGGYPYSYGGYPYAGPAYAYPPVSLGLGFSYYDRGPRYHGGHRHHGHGRWNHGSRGDHGWRGHHRGDGHQHHGGGRRR